MGAQLVSSNQCIQHSAAVCWEHARLQPSCNAHRHLFLGKLNDYQALLPSGLCRDIPLVLTQPLDELPPERTAPQQVFLPVPSVCDSLVFLLLDDPNSSCPRAGQKENRVSFSRQNAQNRPLEGFLWGKIAFTAMQLSS